MKGVLRIFLAAVLLCLAGCERGLHEMYDQPKYKPLMPTTLFPDGNSSRPQVQGTVAYSAGAAADTSSGRDGVSGVSHRPPITPALLARGQSEFEIFCAPCHGEAGDGGGMVVRRGFPAPPSYHIDRLRELPDDHFYDVITHGYGVMYPYSDRIAPADRWAIVAYIRALQLSQHAPASSLTPEDRARLGQTRR